MQSLSSSSPSTLLLSPSPSLTCYSSGNNTLADIAARVVHELSLQDHGLEGDLADPEELFFHEPQPELPLLQLQHQQEEEEEEEVDDDEEVYHDGDEEFEFSFVCGVPESSPVSADEIFHNGQIRPMYEYSLPATLSRPPLAHRRRQEAVNQGRPRRPALRFLMGEDDPRVGEPPEPGFSCSSSESDELEGVDPGTYCVWAPREASPGRDRCRKSSSTGSGSRRWKLKHLLLNRSNSDGRTDALAVPPPTTKGADGDCGKVGGVTEGQGRRSYLPYRTDLVGFFSNVNGLSRNLHPLR
ncbi:uncharacterized protein LOC116215593 [Punica granatum]|uniref:Uncharacterized protein n=2 Tax=Punica granatum TaxID=22663 RepID=A0A218VXZ5_PUNGR|nr:uncharacterized protein LOC116215593 [Punica granatum]OWM65447.1 hypothetical protein CDL15_Pgr009037 [Punica granatum]PKI66659.1 hypothetical protein CRG98_013001 [Punica granatum]